MVPGLAVAESPMHAGSVCIAGSSRNEQRMARAVHQ